MIVALPSGHEHIADALAAAEGWNVRHVDQHIRRFLAELDPLINAQGVLANMGGGGRLSHKLDEMRHHGIDPARRRDLTRDLHRVFGIQPAAAREPIGQALAIEQLHRDVRGVVRFRELAALVHRHDSGMLDLRGAARLLQEALEDLRLQACFLVEELEGDFAIEADGYRDRSDSQLVLA